VAHHSGCIEHGPDEKREHPELEEFEGKILRSGSDAMGYTVRKAFVILSPITHDIQD
jgi:hypothetical protein